ncbi:DUF1800 family protein [Flavobacterium sp.]|uniref:DUF1800 family protein n=1 Tax=Flavobacterium sp. TaxID=239 RepID=UPI000EDE3FF0|nr:DUF1800 family protein [Flavobacterium sp.]HCQ13874.1 hypothetical protein [Flavobacterium sp.]
MASLTPRTGTLGFANAAHLLRRTTFNPNKTLINQFAAMTTDQAVDQLFAAPTYDLPEPIATDTGQKWIPTATTPTVTATTMDANARFNVTTAWWLNNAQKATTIHTKLSLFLKSIFIVNLHDNFGLYFFGYDYYALLNFYATGSIKTFTKKISRLNAMHYYLDNRLNTAVAPNENYARELLELFTIQKGAQDGVGSYTNYTEHDVQQAARVLTGFTNISESQRLSYLDAECNIPLGKKDITKHDTGNKTFSSKFGNQTITGATTAAAMDTELDAFIDMIFNQPETAKSYARRLYRYFVRRTIDTETETDIIVPLANNLMTTNYNMESTVKLLLKSVHFYDEDDTTVGDEIIGSKIKSPLDLFLMINSQFRLQTVSPLVNVVGFSSFYYSYTWGRINTSGFLLFRALTVAGYPPMYELPDYDKLWITTSSLRYRYAAALDNLITGYTANGYTFKLDVVAFVRNSGDFSNPANATTLVNEFLELCFCDMPTGSRYTFFQQALLGNLSPINWQNEWNNYITTNNSASVKTALDRFIKAIVKSPEYQLL